MGVSRASRKRFGMIVGKVEFREGEGIMLEIRMGTIEIELTRADATLSWTDGNYRGQAAMPFGDFRRYVADGAIALE
jgi:glutathione S-transferase